MKMAHEIAIGDRIMGNTNWLEVQSITPTDDPARPTFQCIDAFKAPREIKTDRHISNASYEVEPTRYTENIPEYGDVMTVEEFNEYVENGFFSDCDGFGHPAKHNLMDGDTVVKPSTRIVGDATHIVWFNR